MPGPAPEEVTEFLCDYDESVRDMALHTRALVLKLVPDAEESVLRRWKTISYGRGGKFCAISPHQSWVNLQFHGGAKLTDADSLLEGTGKSMRHVKLHQPKDLKRPGVRALILQASVLARKK